MLFNPATLPVVGKVKSRIAMAAMTRCFASPEHLVTPEIVTYYARRAADGVALILTEGVVIHPSADGYNNVPHIATETQAQSWAPVLNQVHQAGSKIWCQLWHCGRISHPDYTGGLAPVSSTAQRAEGINRQNGQPFGDPRALGVEEMPGIVSMFREAARRAIDVGFDGVQVHMGHGYLIDQFFDTRVNDRTDAYGGSVENRCRLALEVLARVIEEVGAEKVMVRISPSREMGGLYDWPELEAMLQYLMPAMESLGLRAVDISCAASDYYQTSGRVIRMVRPFWRGVILGGASLTVDQAEAELQAGMLDMVTWGRHLLANPDFCTRSQGGVPLVAFDRNMLSTLV